MKTFQIFVSLIATILLIIFCQALAHSQEIDNLRLLEAIRRTENSVKYPYGIKSINTYGNVEYARKICLNSIKNAKKRYAKAGSKGDFIEFMGKRFCPISDCPRLNKNWVKNVRYYYENNN